MAVSSTPKSVAVIQSCYVPWKGYFDIINSVDEFILYDDCQYTRQDWRNRNRVKTARGTRWLTIPVSVFAGVALVTAFTGHPGVHLLTGGLDRKSVV